MKLLNHNATSLNKCFLVNSSSHSYNFNRPISINISKLQQNLISHILYLFQQDSFHRQASKHDNTNQGLVEIATEKLQEAKTWLEQKSPDEDVTIDYLIAIASARFGLVTVATFLFELYCQQSEADALGVSRNQVSTVAPSTVFSFLKDS